MSDVVLNTMADDECDSLHLWVTFLFIIGMILVMGKWVARTVRSRRRRRLLWNLYIGVKMKH